MPMDIPSEVIEACSILTKQGYQAYLVGGAVRDNYLGQASTDWDITTDAPPQTVKNLFERSLPTGIQYGTITVFVANKSLEITTMRKDGPYSDARRPDYIQYTNQLKDDLSRRDFTINSLAYDPLTNQIIDYFSGIKHLKRKLLVTVGEPSERFSEDPLRMLRLLRFQSTLGFKIEKKTRLALPELAWQINKISPERILNEINKMLLGKNLLVALETFYISGLMEEIIPELSACYGVSAGEKHPYDLLGHAITSAYFAAPKLELKWAALLHDLGKLDTLKREHAEISAKYAEKILKQLTAGNQLVNKVTTLIKHHMFGINPHSSDKAIRRFLALVGTKTAFDLIKLRQADMAGMNANPRQILSFGTALEARLNEVLSHKDALSISELEIDGHTLMQTFKLTPGPLIGEILRFLLEKVWENPSLNQQKTLKDLAQEYLRSSQ